MRMTALSQMSARENYPRAEYMRARSFPALENRHTHLLLSRPCTWRLNTFAVYVYQDTSGRRARWSIDQSGVLWPSVFRAYIFMLSCLV